MNPIDTAPATSECEHAEALLDDALRETFPASDPVSVFVPTARDVHGAD